MEAKAITASEAAAGRARRGAHRYPSAVRRSFVRRLAVPAAWILAGVVLFPLYVRLSNTGTENSDSSNIILMANDMLHGNLLLHGWYSSDVSFYTTELPQYALLERLFGLRPEVGHIAAGMTYTLVVLLTVALARGRAKGRAVLVRTLIAGGILLAPQIGGGVFAMDLSVGHIGTSVPLLLVWLLLDRTQPRRYVPVITTVLLTWVLIADRLVIVTGLLPLALACVVRMLPGLFSTDGESFAARLGARWYDLSLIAATVAAYSLAALVERTLTALGGYHLEALPFRVLSLSAIPANIVSVFSKLLLVFGADFIGTGRGILFYLAILHLASGFLVFVALLLVIWRYRTGVELVDLILAIAIALNVGAYALTSAGQNAAHEIAIVVPFSAALAARMLVGEAWPMSSNIPARHACVAYIAGLLVLAGYVAGFGYDDTQPVAPAANVQLASWLSTHHLTEGLSGYWTSSSVTVASAGHVKVRALVPGGVLPEMWMTYGAWYNPQLSSPNFIVVDLNDGFYDYWAPLNLIRKQFGSPIRTKNYQGYLILIYNKNLLLDIPGAPQNWPDGQAVDAPLVSRYASPAIS
jgi:hypothetical protein